MIGGGKEESGFVEASTNKRHICSTSYEVSGGRNVKTENSLVESGMSSLSWPESEIKCSRDSVEGCRSMIDSPLAPTLYPT